MTVEKVRRALRDRAFTTESFLEALNREVVPVVRELRQRFNELIDALANAPSMSRAVFPVLLPAGTAGPVVINVADTECANISEGDTVILNLQDTSPFAQGVVIGACWHSANSVQFTQVPPAAPVTANIVVTVLRGF